MVGSLNLTISGLPAQLVLFPFHSHSHTVTGASFIPILFSLISFHPVPGAPPDDEEQLQAAAAEGQAPVVGFSFFLNAERYFAEFVLAVDSLPFKLRLSL